MRLAIIGSATANSVWIYRTNLFFFISFSWYQGTERNKKEDRGGDNKGWQKNTGGTERKKTEDGGGDNKDE